MKNETHSKTVVFHCPGDRKKQTNKNKDSDIIFLFLLPLKNILDLFMNYFLGQKDLVLRRALLEHSLLVGIYAKGVLALYRNSSEQKKLLDKSRNQHLVIVSAL